MVMKDSGDEATDCLVNRRPAKLFENASSTPPGEGFSEEALKLTTLSKYLELYTWTQEECAFLVCGIKPETFKKTAFGQELPNAMSLAGVRLQGKSAFAQKEQVLLLLNRDKTQPAEVTPHDFLAWCKTNGIDTSWLAEIETCNKPEPEDGKEKNKRETL